MTCSKIRQKAFFPIAEVLEALEEAYRTLGAEAERLRPPEPTPLQQALTDCGCFVVCEAMAGRERHGARRCAAKQHSREVNIDKSVLLADAVGARRRLIQERKQLGLIIGTPLSQRYHPVA